MVQFELISYDTNETAVLACQMLLDLLAGTYIDRNTYDLNQTKFKRMIRSIRNALAYRDETGYQLMYYRKGKKYFLYKSNVNKVRKNLKYWWSYF